MAAAAPPAGTAMQNERLTQETSPGGNAGAGIVCQAWPFQVCAIGEVLTEPAARQNVLLRQEMAASAEVEAARAALAGAAASTVTRIEQEIAIRRAVLSIGHIRSARRVHTYQDICSIDARPADAVGRLGVPGHR